jgi:dihydroorotase
MDVAVVKDKIAAVEKDIPASQAGKVVDATGLYVTPGLVDIHVHIGHGGAPLDWFTPEGRSHLTPYGIPADIALQSGVTTMVDAGSSGADTFLLEKEEVIDRAKVRVLAFLNIVANGMQGDLEQSVDQMDVKRCAETIKKYPDIIVGVKTAHYWTEEPWGRRTHSLGRRGPGRRVRTGGESPGDVRFLAAAGPQLRRSDT